MGHRLTLIKADKDRFYHEKEDPYHEGHEDHEDIGFRLSVRFYTFRLGGLGQPPIETDE